MRVRDILREDVLFNHQSPVYDGYPGERAYLIEQGQIVQAKAGCFISCPLEYLEDADPDDLTFRLLRHVAELGRTLDFEPSFAAVRQYFTELTLPFATIVRNPATVFDVPGDVALVDYTMVPSDRIYCLTRPTYLGVSPVRNPGTVAFDAANSPVSLETRGFLLYNPQGVLTVRAPG